MLLAVDSVMARKGWSGMVEVEQRVCPTADKDSGLVGDWLQRWSVVEDYVCGAVAPHWGFVATYRCTRWSAVMNRCNCKDDLLSKIRCWLYMMALWWVLRVWRETTSIEPVPAVSVSKTSKV